MSHKDLVKTPDYYVMNTRGGYRVWMNPLFQQDAKSTKASTFGDEDDNGGDDDQLPEPEGQDDDNIDEVRPRREDVQDNEERSPKDTDPDKSVGDIQILELHSKNPIIAYRGRVFSASWASNIGTELLFAEQDPAAEGALPALRHLPGDIDLLAASSARLLTSLIELKPIEDDTPGGLAAEREAREKRLERARQKHNISIPVVGDRYGKRAPQARFLENLMAIKRLRGETDEVTVHTMETRQNDVEDDPEEMVERRKRAKATERHRKNSHKRQELMRASLGDAHRWGGGRPRGKGSRGPYKERAVLDIIGAGSTAGSTPTPGQWNDLAQPAAGAEDDTTMQDGAGDNDDEDSYPDEV